MGSNNSYRHILDLAFQKDGKLLAADSRTNLYRFLSDGFLDNTFGTNGIANPGVNSSAPGGDTRLCLQDDGKALLSFGPSDFTVARFDGGPIKLPTLSGRCISVVPTPDFAGIQRNKLPGVTVKLFKGNTLIQSTTSDAEGNYQFVDVAGGTYSVKATFPIVRNGETRERVLDPVRTVQVSGVDIEVSRFAFYSIFGGIRLPNKSGNYNPANGATVELYNGNNVLLESVTTGADGRYQFRSLFAGNFKVVAKLAGYTFTPAKTGLPAFGDAAFPAAKIVLKGTKNNPAVKSSSQAF